MAASWHVLKGPGGYLGTVWQGNSSGGLVRPRTAMIRELNPPPYHFVSLCHGPDEARQRAADALQILGVKCEAIPVEVAGRGKDAKIVELAGAIGRS